MNMPQGAEARKIDSENFFTDAPVEGRVDVEQRQGERTLREAQDREARLAQEQKERTRALEERIESLKGEQEALEKLAASDERRAESLPEGRLKDDALNTAKRRREMAKALAGDIDKLEDLRRRQTLRAA